MAYRAWTSLETNETGTSWGKISKSIITAEACPTCGKPFCTARWKHLHVGGRSFADQRISRSSLKSDDTGYRPVSVIGAAEIDRRHRKTVLISSKCTRKCLAGEEGEKHWFDGNCKVRKPMHGE